MQIGVNRFFREGENIGNGLELPGMVSFALPGALVLQNRAQLTFISNFIMIRES